MDAATFEAYLDEFPIEWERGAPGAWWLRGNAEEGTFRLAAQLTETALTVLFRFSDHPVRTDEESLAQLLDFNADFLNFKLALDPANRVWLVGSWPAPHLTRDQTNFLVIEFLLHIGALYEHTQGFVV